MASVTRKIEFNWLTLNLRKKIIFYLKNSKLNTKLTITIIISAFQTDGMK